MELTKVQSITEIFKANLSKLEMGQAFGKQKLEELKASKITNDEEREVFMSGMVKCRAAYEKIKRLRMEVTAPLDELKKELMSFERDLDDNAKDNMFAEVKKIINTYDEAKLQETRAKEQKAERDRQIKVYQSELNATVGKACIEMLSGQQRNLIDGTAKWEAQLTLENFADSEKTLNTPKEAHLKIEKYDACFHTNFNKSNLMNEEETKAFIDSLKLIYPYDLYDKKYLQIRAEIHNALRAKMPTIKAQLIEAKNNKELADKRLADIEAEKNKNLKASEEAASKDLTEVVNQKDLTVIEASFQKQGVLQDVQAGPTKKEAVFNNDTLWLKPFLSVVQAVAATGKVNIRKANGEYAPHIAWWMKAVALLNQPIEGITLNEQAKTIIKEKKEEV